MAATDMPEEGELVLATVKKIMPYGAFCTLDEYGNREAFVHISEVAPRWIKNIHEFLHEGQRLVAKVFKLVAEKNQIDLTLKGVSESEKKAKMEDSRRTRRSDKLFEVALKIAKSTKSEELVARAALAAKFGGIGEAFEALGEQGEAALAGVKIEKGLAKALSEVASKSAKKSRAEITWTLSLTAYTANGVEDIKKILSSVKGPPDTQLTLHYLGAPHYQIKAVAEDFKHAEKALETVTESIAATAKQLGAHLEIEKSED
ncbi:MAG: S1 RNA-binding domain-containing protein [Candidatus Micrarchaeota archaeon]|nr:S1 RNA-binding domain-containing protein [Candidatus Micrarchaeota archaeon]